MGCDPDGARRVNLFALVTYIPDPLGSFLDRLRQELVPSCSLKAHVTILPPRPVSPGPDEAWEQLRSRMSEFSPFEIEATEIDIFPVTSVVHIAVGSGSAELKRMHDALNVDAMEFRELFSYHPHITLAQELIPKQVEEVYELARHRWASFPHKRSFPAETVTFVQYTSGDKWIDLASCALGAGSLHPLEKR